MLIQKVPNIINFIFILIFGSFILFSQKNFSFFYFEVMPETVHIRQGYNPATWMLEVIGEGVGSNRDVEYAQVFTTSERRKALMEQLKIEGVTSPSPDYPALAAALLSTIQFLFMGFNPPRS